MSGRTAAIGVAAGLLLASCDAAKTAIDDATGTFSGTRGDVALVIDQGYASPDVVLRDADQALAAIGEAGALVSALILDGQSASGAMPVEFSPAAGGGNAFPSGKNPDSWEREADEFATAASEDLRAAFSELPPADPGADLLGGLGRGLSIVAGGEDDEPRIVVVITGGGVHRNGQLDLIALDPADLREAAVAAAASVSDPTGVVVVIAGVARFSEVEQSIDDGFVDKLTAFWNTFCMSLEERGAVACRTGPSMERNLFRLADES